MGRGLGAVLGVPAPWPQPIRAQDPRPPARSGLGRGLESRGCRGGPRGSVSRGSSVPGQDLLSYVSPQHTQHTGKVAGLEGPPYETRILNELVEARASLDFAAPSQARLERVGGWGGGK